jgi:CheY-like chemotaxis protein
MVRIGGGAAGPTMRCTVAGNLATSRGIASAIAAIVSHAACARNDRCEHRSARMATRVLIIESDANLAHELACALAAHGCEVSVCGDGEAGLAHAMSSRPDVIVLAVELPDTNGFSVCNRLKKHAELQSVPLLVTSTQCDDETFEQHKKLRTHADDYVRKPVAVDRLLERLKRLVPNLTNAEHASSAYRAPVDEVSMPVEPDAPRLEAALARAIDRASAAGRWDVVTQLARELEARRKS